MSMIEAACFFFKNGTISQKTWRRPTVSGMEVDEWVKLLTLGNAGTILEKSLPKLQKFLISEKNTENIRRYPLRNNTESSLHYFYKHRIDFRTKYIVFGQSIQFLVRRRKREHECIMRKIIIRVFN